MSQRDPRIDAYIAKSAGFAKPILTYLRDAIHEAVPDVEETMKWGMPSFDYKGPMLNVAGFKGHCAVGFWKGSLLGLERSDDAMEHFRRITSIKDLPPKKELVRLFKKAAALNEEGVKVERKKPAKKPVETPDDLAAALEKNKKAAAVYDKFAPSHRREYVDWITGAKSDETRKRRIEQAVEWMAEGKQRNWKYMKK